MNFKNFTMILAILVVFILAIGAVSAENIYVNDVTSADGGSTGDYLDVVAKNSVSDGSDAKTHIITNDNYNNYFDISKNGTLKSDSGVNDGDTVKIANVSEKVFTFNKNLTITSDKGDSISNGYVHLISGASGSIVNCLTIINNMTTLKVNDASTGSYYTYSLHGLWLTSVENCTISNNYIETSKDRGVFAMPLTNASYNNISNNIVMSGASTCMPMGASSYNLIANNYLSSVGANIIYYNPFGHADYSSSLYPGSNDYNQIINNTLNGTTGTNSLWCYAIQLMTGKYATIINNTIINAALGISLPNTMGSVVKGNKLSNIGSTAISVPCNNIIVEANEIDVGVTGIQVAGCNVTVKDNFISANKPVLVNGSSVAKTINDLVVIGNTINSSTNGIILSGYVNDANVSDNIIYAGEIGINIIPLSPSNPTTPTGTLMENNNITAPTPISTSFILNETTYSTFFDENGILKEGVLSEDDVLIVGNLANKNLYINQAVILDGNNKGTLTNCTIYLGNGEGGTASGSIIRNLIIKNKDKYGIVLNQYTVSSFILNNKINVSASSGNAIGIIAYGYTGYNVIDNNTLYISSTSNTYTYGIEVIATLNDWSSGDSIARNYTISNNKINVNSDYLSEPLYLTLSDSIISNNVITASSTANEIYGLAIDNVNPFYPTIDVPNNILITNNTFNLKNTANDKISFGITFATGGTNVKVLDNTINMNASSGAYGIGFNNCENVSVSDNHINLLAGSSVGVESYTFTNGSAAVYSKGSNSNIENNFIYTNITEKQINHDETSIVGSNAFIIDNHNFNKYFTSTYRGLLKNTSSIKVNDTILFGNVTFRSIILDKPLSVSSIDSTSVITNGQFILTNEASGSEINNVILNKSDGYDGIILNQSSNNVINNVSIIINTTNNVDWTMCGIRVISGNGNRISNNYIKLFPGRSFNNNRAYYYYGIIVNNYDNLKTGAPILPSPLNNSIINNVINVSSELYANGIYNSMADSTIINNNTIYLNARNFAYGIVNEYSPTFDDQSGLVKKTNNTHIANNTIVAKASMIYGIENFGAENTNILSNKISAFGNASYAYASDNTKNDIIKNNNIEIHGIDVDNVKNNLDMIKTGHAGIYLTYDVTNATIESNYIVSYYEKGGDYGVLIDEGCVNNNVRGNYIVSDNDNKQGNAAVSASVENTVIGNIPVGEYVPTKVGTVIEYQNMTTESVAAVDGRVGKMFRVVLKDAKGNPLDNKAIQIGFNGKIYNRVTDENGAAELQINLGVAGGYTFAICFLGDGEYNASFAVAKITVVPQKLKVIVPNKVYKAVAKTKTLTTTVLSNKGGKIAGIVVTFKVNGKIYTAKTDAKGVAKVNVSLTAKKTYSFTVSYVGGNKYAKFTKTAKVTIN